MPINYSEVMHGEKSVLSSNHKQKFLEFTGHYWNFEWNQVLWADEVFFFFFSPMSTQGGFGYTEENLILVVTYGGGSGNLVGIVDSIKNHEWKSGNSTSAKRVQLGCDRILEQDSD